MINYGWAFIDTPFVPKKLVEMVNGVLHSSNKSQGNRQFDAREDPRGGGIKRFGRLDAILTVIFLYSQAVKPTQQLHDLGQSLWLNNIDRELVASGTPRRYIGDLSVTSLTSNPSISDPAIGSSTFYDDPIRQKTREGKSGPQPRRLLWASTGAKGPEASDVLYVKALAAPDGAAV